jgi:hypothetical protein
VRVSAWNGVGNVYGRSAYALPAAVLVHVAPGPVTDLHVEPSGPAALNAKSRRRLQRRRRGRAVHGRVG